MFKHFDLPTIIVVDSDKGPDDQLQTMIILYRPPDPEHMEKISPKTKNKSDRASRTNSFNHKKSELSNSRSDSGGRKHNSRERQNKQSGRFSSKDSEERGKNKRTDSGNKRTLTDSRSLNRSRTTERKRQKDKIVTNHLDEPQKKKSTSQDSLFVKKGKLTHSKWKSDGQLHKQHYKEDRQERYSDGNISLCIANQICLQSF
jgi:hypothetical protein